MFFLKGGLWDDGGKILAVGPVNVSTPRQEEHTSSDERVYSREKVRFTFLSLRFWGRLMLTLESRLNHLAPLLRERKHAWRHPKWTHWATANNTILVYYSSLCFSFFAQRANINKYFFPLKFREVTSACHDSYRNLTIRGVWRLRFHTTTNNEKLSAFG